MDLLTQVALFTCAGSQAGAVCQWLRQVNLSPIEIGERTTCPTGLGIEGAVTIEAIEAVIYEDDEARDVRLGECDDQYFENAGDLSDPLFEFIKNNRDKIILKD